MKVKSIKTKTYDSGKFNITKDYQVLMCSNIEGNNNKFYVIELQYNSENDIYRLFSNYGRLNTSNVYEIREPFHDYELAKKEMNRIIKNKLRPKKKKKNEEVYVEQYEKVEVAKSSIGSSNIRDNPLNIKSDKFVLDTSNLSGELASTLNEIIEANVHAIENTTDLQVTKDGLKTPVGYLSLTQINNAKLILKEINDYVDSNGEFTCDKDTLKTLNIKFFSLIPHPFGRKILEEECIFNVRKLEEKFELIDQLQSSLTVKDNKNNKFGIEIELEKNQGIINNINKRFNETKTPNHRNLNSWFWEIDKVFKIKIPEERERYDNSDYPQDYKYPFIELWHGSRVSNILSILLNGLIIPHSNASHVCGRMFGNGIYGATSSTKSLNYSLGYWNNDNKQLNSCYLLLCEFKLGNCYECKNTLYTGPPRNYHSVYAKAGHSLINDEIIVYNLNQATIKYLIKMKNIRK